MSLWEDRSVNALFAVDFISSNPSGTPEDWVCDAASVSAVDVHPYYLSISDHVFWNFDSFQTIVPSDAARKYQAYWTEVFVENQAGLFEVDIVAEAEICSAKR